MVILSFDLDGTLVHQEYSEYVWRVSIPELVAKSRSIGIDEARSFVYSEYDSVGDHSIEWYRIEYWFNRFELGDDWQRVMTQNVDRIRPYPEVQEVLHRLRELYELIIISNATREFISIELKEAGLSDCFSRVYSATSDFGEVKKTERFYGRICTLLGIEPVEMIHVGDHFVFDYRIPRELGIRAFYLDRKGDQGRGHGIVRDLREFEEQCRLY